MGTHPIAGAVRKSARLEGEQLLPACDRPARPHRAAPSRTHRSVHRAFGSGRAVMREVSPSSALRRALSAAARIPYSAHVTPLVIRSAFGDYLQAFRVGGAGFESAEDAQLNNWHERLKSVWSVGSYIIIK